MTIHNILSDTFVYLSAVIWYTGCAAGFIYICRHYRVLEQSLLAPIVKRREEMNRYQIEKRDALVMRAFWMLIIGIMTRELAVMIWGALGWPDSALLLSAFARMIMLTAPYIFIHALTFHRCGHKCWAWTLIGIMLLSLIHR